MPTIVSGEGRKEGVNEQREREGEMEIGNAHISSLDEATIDQKEAKRVNKACGSSV